MVTWLSLTRENLKQRNAYQNSGFANPWPCPLSCDHAVFESKYLIVP